MKRVITALAALVFVLVFAGCSKQAEPAGTAPPLAAEQEAGIYLPALTTANETPTGWTQRSQEPTPEPTATPDPWTMEDVEAMARTLSGECYDDKAADKRLVCEVILNRVSNGYWGGTVAEVVTAKGQFNGYYHPSREVTANDREIAEETLRDWYAGGCIALSEYLYFEAGPNRENVFRKNYK